MATAITMPKFGQTMTEGEISRWVRQEGERVEKGEVFLVIESDKAVMDVESEHSGYLLKILARPGDVVPCGQVIAYLGELGESVP
jgi:pyruvate/2-oxoglutarate dehydrogenase complex dihydrolipoamide acyltransferase (E2) component